MCACHLLIDTNRQCAHYSSCSRRRTVEMLNLIREHHRSNDDCTPNHSIFDGLAARLAGARLVPVLLFCFCRFE